MLSGNKPKFRRVETSEEGEEGIREEPVKGPLTIPVMFTSFKNIRGIAKCKDIIAEWQHKSVYQVIKNCDMYSVRRAPK